MPLPLPLPLEVGFTKVGARWARTCIPRDSLKGNRRGKQKKNMIISYRFADSHWRCSLSIQLSIDGILSSTYRWLTWGSASLASSPTIDEIRFYLRYHPSCVCYCAQVSTRRILTKGQGTNHNDSFKRLMSNIPDQNHIIYGEDTKDHEERERIGDTTSGT